MKLNIVIVGVGGQGALTTAYIIARSAMKAGLNVMTAETHGMAQRGGSVEAHVRIGDVKSPTVPIGSADVMIALEPSESLRYSKYLNENSIVILNDKPIIPPTVSVGVSRYPSLEEIIESLKRITKRVYVVKASEIAEEIGNIRVTNVVVVGILLKLLKLPFNYEHVESVLKDIMSGDMLNLNLKALEAGFKLAQPSEV